MLLETTVVVPAVHWTSVLGTTVVIQETVRVRMIHHLAITASSRWLLVVGVEVLGVLRTLVEASPAIISVAVIIASWSRPPIMVLILRRESPPFVRMRSFLDGSIFSLASSPSLRVRILLILLTVKSNEFRHTNKDDLLTF